MTRDLVRCIFPSDGATMLRSHEGCGCLSWDTESCSSQGWDWCTPKAPWDGRLHHEARRNCRRCWPNSRREDFRTRTTRQSSMERSGIGPLARVCGPSSCPLGQDRLATSPAIATRPSQRGIPGLRRYTVAKRFSPSTRPTRKNLLRPFNKKSPQQPQRPLL